MIDYHKIATAVRHYGGAGFKYIEVPWLISRESMMITAPPGVRLFDTFAGSLVASGEQSFLEIRKELLKANSWPALYQCVTPCFRDEPIKDDLHLLNFMKCELIAINWRTFEDKEKVPKELLNCVIRNALDFFRIYAYEDSDKLELVESPMPNSVVNYDINIRGVEVGSYGYRYTDDFAWVYGTGVAEPRLTQVLRGK
jgi:aspartyl/asparaginyl-tRNA synthetase